MKKSLATLLVAATAASFGATAFAQTNETTETTQSTGPSTVYPGGTQTTTVTTTTDTIVLPRDQGLSKDAAKDAKIQSAADLKARKKIADANLALDKANCETSADTIAVARACKSDAKAQANKDKAEAKVINAQEKADIKANTQQ